MNLKEIDPIDFAGAVGHAAAAQFYVMLTGDESQNWPGCVMTAKDDSNLAQVVDLLARYVVKREAGGATLYTHARLEGMTAHPGVTEPPPGSLCCYSLFAAATLKAHFFLQKLLAMQEEAERGRAPQPNAGLKLEDSIFAPEKPLDYMEPHQAAHLAALGAALAAPSIETAAQAITIGESISAEPPAISDLEKQRNAPASRSQLAREQAITIGTRGEDDNAQGAAAAGQEASETGEDAGEAPPPVCADGAAGPGEADAGQEDGPGAPAAGEAGPAEALPTDDGTVQDGGETPVKPSKAKSAN